MAARRGPTPGASIDDWLNLVDPDGAFLTPSQLRAGFPHGFDPLTTELRAELRAQVADLDAGHAARVSLREWLLRSVLEWGDNLAEGQQLPPTSNVRVPEHGVLVRPTQALLDVDDANRIRVAVFVWPTGTRLQRRPDATIAGDMWPASPVQRAETWCRESGVPLGLVTDDDYWALVWAPRGAPSASCRWRIGELADERILQAGFLSLLGAKRFFAVKEDETLEALFSQAADAEAEITRGLGLSVRRSVELLVAAISRDDVATDGAALRDVSSTEVYEAAVTVLMRLVFLLFAEERRMLPAEDPLWAESYSVLTLREDLRSSAVRDGEDALERRSTAWHRLLATFRAVHGGVNHDRLTLPAYGGSLFDPARFPFLEGRMGSGAHDRPIAIDDRTVLAILDALLTIQVKAGRSRVAQRVSYKALDVEQIGHCYEGLLDHGAVRIPGLSLGLVGPEGAEPEISIVDLETRLAKGIHVLCDWLADSERCNRTSAALAGLLERQPEGVELARLRVACGHDDDTVARVLPFWGLIRNDLRGLPVVLLPGSQYVTQTSNRRNTGAQYTTKALAEEVVQYALEPLVYEPGPQNEADQTKWKLRPPEAILDLRVCDPAVGSGAILTAAGRYLAARLIESVAEYGPGSARFAERLRELAAASSEDQVVLARREIVDHCLYGVDKNPVAAEMAKLSLWLTTVARERPFTFLDHAIQVGDSLLGITDLDQLRWLNLDPAQRRFEALAIDPRIREATELARRVQALSVTTVRDAAEKQRLNDELRAKLADLAIVADTVVGAALSTASKRGLSMEDRLSTQVHRIETALDDISSDLERSAALATLRQVSNMWLRTDLPEMSLPSDRQCLHWPLAFPEVFLGDARMGFDAVVANPPFLGGKRISGANGVAYREHLVMTIARGATGNADLLAYFLLRMCDVGHSIGSLATNTVSQGDTREVGLDRIIDGKWVCHRAVKSDHWPNEATIEIAKLWLWLGDWTGARYLNGSRIDANITSSLERESRVTGSPERLVANRDRSFIGCALNTTAFILTEVEASELIQCDPMNAEVVKPFLNGQEFNEDPRQRPSRWVVDFQDWEQSRAERFAAPFALLLERVRNEVLSKSGYPGWSQRWWQFWRPRRELASAIADMDRVLAIALTSKTVMPAFQPKGMVYSHAVGVFAYDDDAHLGLLSSAFHWWWTISYASTMRTDIRYTPSDVFETFPQPEPQRGPDWERLGVVAGLLDNFRATLMIEANLGLTKTYNRIHDPDEHDASIGRLRELHIDLDRAVRDAYGWTDLELDHQHWETPQGMRFTVSPAAKDELLDRLLELNHQRYAEEVAAGLHDVKANKQPAIRSSDANNRQASLV